MKTLLAIILLIPSLSWGKEIFLNCEKEHGLKKEHLDITVVIKDFPLNAKIILFSKDVRNELKLSQSEIEYFFSGKAISSWLVNRGELMMKKLEKDKYENIEGTLNKISLELEIEHIDDDKQIAEWGIMDAIRISSYKCYKTSKQI